MDRDFCSPTPPLGPQTKWIPEPVPSLELPYLEEEKVARMDSSVVKKKQERNPMTQEQKRRPENTKTWKKAKKNTGHQRAVCPGI